jgi:Clr5 domain
MSSRQIYRRAEAHHSSEEWEILRPDFERHYAQRNGKLSTVAKIMKDLYGFDARYA